MIEAVALDRERQLQIRAAVAHRPDHVLGIADAPFKARADPTRDTQSISRKGEPSEFLVFVGKFFESGRETSPQGSTDLEFMSKRELLAFCGALERFLTGVNRQGFTRG